MKRNVSLSFLALQVLSFAALAQDTEVIIAERPGFSSSPIALSPDAVQLETGYQYTRDTGAIDIYDHTLPLALFRVGLAEGLEVQLNWSGYTWADVGGEDLSGASDASLGVKWQLTDRDAAASIALFAGVSLPVGSDEFGSDDYDPSLGMFWSYGANLDWFGTVLLGESDGDLSVGNAIGIGLPVNDRTSGYVEYYGLFEQNTGPEHYLNGGIAYLPANHMQLDLNVGAGLNGRAADFFLGFGLAYRF